MMKLTQIALVLGVLGFASNGFADPDAKGHCHGKDKDGKEVKIEAASEKECKDKSGTWSAPAAKKEKPAEKKEVKEPAGGGW